MWDYTTRKFRGGCLPQHPCPAGQRGSHPASWVDKPWRLKKGLNSSRLQPKLVGACEFAPCPAHSIVNASSGLCECSGSYIGVLRWNMSTEAYEGQCKPTFDCPAHATHRVVPISTTQHRLGCVCIDGYRGG